MIIGVASDHQGYKLKNKIQKYLNKKYDIIDYGTYTNERVDYTDYAVMLSKGIKKKQIDYGILICGTGIGMSIAANKIKGIMCAKVNSQKEAYYAKAHNDANVISLSAKLPFWEIKDILDTYLTTEFINEKRYLERIKKIKNLENCSKTKK